MQTYLSFVKQTISNFAASKAAPQKSKDMASYPVKRSSHQFYVTNGQSQAHQS